MKEVFLSERWRPKTFDNVIGLSKNIPKLINNDMPHLLFTGPPGTGKTTTVKIIIKELGCKYLRLNASDERGINVVRDKIKEFAMTGSTNNKFKVVHLDEGDQLTISAQDALRNLMETYASNCRFAITGNYENKITDAIKSRCTVFRFQNISSDLLVVHLRHVCNVEKVMITDAALIKIVDIYKSDIRKMLNKIQELIVNKTEIVEKDISDIDLTIPKMWNLISNKMFIQARQIALDSCTDYVSLIDQLGSYVLGLSDTELPPLRKGKIIKHIGECNRYIKNVPLPDVEFMFLILNIIGDLNA